MSIFSANVRSHYFPSNTKRQKTELSDEKKPLPAKSVHQFIEEKSGGDFLSPAQQIKNTANSWPFLQGFRTLQEHPQDQFAPEKPFERKVPAKRRTQEQEEIKSKFISYVSANPCKQPKPKCAPNKIKPDVAAKQVPVDHTQATVKARELKKPDPLLATVLTRCHLENAEDENRREQTLANQANQKPTSTKLANQYKKASDVIQKDR